MASSLTSIKRYGMASVLAGISALALCGPAWSQDRASPLRHHDDPHDHGNTGGRQHADRRRAAAGRAPTRVTRSRSGSGGAATTPSPHGCIAINAMNSTPFYRLTDADANQWIALARYVRLWTGERCSTSAPRPGPCARAPTPTPVADARDARGHPGADARRRSRRPPPPGADARADHWPGAAPDESQKMMSPDPAGADERRADRHSARASPSSRSARRRRPRSRSAARATCPRKRWSPDQAQEDHHARGRV